MADDYFKLVAEWKANREKKEKLEEQWEELDRQIGLLQIDLVEVNWKLREARKAHLELTARVGDAAAAAFGGTSTSTGTNFGRAPPLLLLRHMR